ncbi:MAG: alpha/beta hydrolase [Chthoniobacterales bacterium]|nr:alpha/beta hydrolase [Chthoniobacterales bacterium]
MKKILLQISLLFLIWCSLFQSLKADGFMTLPDGNTLCYEDQGHGQPIVFITGWTGTHLFFEKQMAYFSQRYRVITFDPRGQGLSPSTLSHNTYEQHGKDLHDLIEKLQLKDVILVGWSFGCRDAYAYVRQYGTQNIKAVVCIDQAPKGAGQADEWHSPGAGEKRQAASNGIEHDRYNFTKQLVVGMNDRELTSAEIQKWTDQMLQTPSYVALLLLGDASLTDYTKEAELLDKQNIPVLNVVASPVAALSAAWLKIHAPHATLIKTWDKHMMFWEHADEFNQALDDFLKQATHAADIKK